MTISASGEDPDDCRHDRLAVENPSEEDRWRGSPGYGRYCAAAERTQLNRWVYRQLAPVHAEPSRFFDVLGAHDGADGPALLLPSGEGAKLAREH